MCEVEREMREYHEDGPDEMTPEEREQEHQSRLFELWKEQRDIDEHDAAEMVPTRPLTKEEQDEIPF